MPEAFQTRLLDPVKSEPYDPTDYRAVRERLFNNTKAALLQRFPVENERYVLSVDELTYDDKEPTLRDEKNATLKNANITKKLRGRWVLTNKETGEVKKSQPRILMNVPYMTRRGTFIRNGSEKAINYMFRLTPGVYSRKKDNGLVEAHVNPKQGTGGQFKIELDPKTGIMRVRKGTRGYKLYPLLKRAGVTDDQIKKSWGKELLDVNRQASDVPNPVHRFQGGVSKVAADYASHYDELLEQLQKSELDPVATEMTLGRAHKKITPETLLESSAKIIRLSKGEEEADYRDGLEFQKIDGPADYFAERIIRDGGGLARNLLWRISRSGDFKDIPPAPLNKHVDAIFNESKHAGYIDGSSPFSAIDLSTKITRIGEGGIASGRTAPSETRAVQDSFAGFIDPVRSVESTRVGLDMYLNQGVRKGDDGRLYTRMIDARTGEERWVDSLTAARSKVATKKEMQSNGKFVPAFRGSRGIGIVPKKEVNFYIPDESNMYSFGANAVPGKNGIMANRLHMGGKYGGQSMPLAHREAPLFRAKHRDTTVEAKLGEMFGVNKASDGGRVASIDADKIVVRGVKGTQVYELYDNHPFNQKGYMRSIPQVKVGDEIKPGQVLSTTNYTDDEGVAAQGRNLRVAYMPWKGMNFEDAIIISASAAKKMAAEKMYKSRIPVSSNTDFDKKAFMGKFSGKFTKEQMGTIGEKGIVKRGTVVREGDPLIVAVRQNDPKPGSMGRKTKTALTQTWEHKYEGKVVDVDVGDKHATVYVRANIPMKNGDKMCYDEETEVLTERGWCVVSDLMSGDKVASLNPDTHEIEYVEVSYLHEYAHEGRMHMVNTTQVNFCTTADHKHYAKLRHKDSYELIPSSRLHGMSRYRLLKTGTWLGQDANTFKLPDVYKTLPHGKNDCHPTLVEGPEVAIDTYLMVMGLFLSDGNIVWQDKTSDYAFDICVAKGDNPQIVRDAFDAAGLKWSTTGDKVRVYSKHWATYLRQFGKSYEKYIPENILELPPERIAVFYEWFMFGDGYRTQSGHGIHTTSYRLAGDWQRVCLHLGMSATIKRKAIPKHPVVINGKTVQTIRPSYIVSTYRQKNQPTINHSHVKKQSAQTDEWVDYVGNVYCPELERNHILYTRRNGKTVWSGNSNRYAAKGVVNVLPDSEMPLDKDGNPLDVVANSLGIIGRVNPMQVVEVMAGKLARHTGKPEAVEGFEDKDLIKYYEQKLRDSGISPNEDLYDPQTGRKIPEVLTGDAFFHRMMHVAEDKIGARGVGGVTAEETPLRGGPAGAKQMGGLHTSAVVSHGAMQVLKDAKLVRGQSNDEFWRDFRLGRMPKVPGKSLVHEKFYKHLQAAGINVDENSDRVNFFGMTNDQARKLSKGHELQIARTFDQKTMKPIDGGLFDPKLFGHNGDDWAYIQLDEPMPNPVMERSMSNILNMTQKRFNAIMNGEEELNGLSGGNAIKAALGKLDLKNEVKSALQELKHSKPSKKDKALKRYRALKSMEEQGVHPKDFMMERIPVLPPKFRPVTQLEGVNVSADANMMYRSLVFARDDLRSAKDRLPDEMLKGARGNIYKSYKALTGLYDPDDAKLEEKNVQGLLKWVFGKGSAKRGAYHRRILGTSMDVAGRGVVTPNPALKLNQMGIPIKQAWDVYEPFVVRAMVRHGYGPTAAIKMVKDRDDRAQKFLQDAVKQRPVIVNRAPSLHKYSVMAFDPVLVKGDTVQVSPSIVGPYGMDFDGDTVTYYVPVSKNAVEEAREKMMPKSNLLSARSFRANYTPSQEFVQGLYLATRAKKEKPKKTFRTVKEAQEAFNKGEIDIDTPIVIVENK